MPNQSILQAFVAHIAALQFRGFRGIVQISGTESYCVASAEALIKAAGWPDVRWLPDVARKISLTQSVQSLLGTETDALVMNAFQGFNPNALGAAAGCIKAGGVLFLLTPDDWAGYADPDYQRMLSHQYLPAEIKGRFIRHVLAALDANNTVLAMRENTENRVWPVLDKAHERFARSFDEQQQAVAAIKRVATGHAKRPLVIQADRGRGKTSALGIAAAELMQERSIRIVVTAAHRNSVQALFHHAANACGAKPDADTMVIAGSSLRFMAVDAVPDCDEVIDLLLVDEAAAIPSALLDRLVDRCKRIVFATTVQGYEGNGRGFAIRFLPRLQQRLPQLRLLELVTPVRYAMDDPLEAFCNAALLLKTAKTSPADIASLQCQHIDRDALLNDKPQLQQLFGLLVSAHYQTTPDDLRIMLDHPDVSIYTLAQQGVVVAVALLMAEGGFSQQECRELTEQQRRFRGHLLPQTFAISGFAGILGLKTQRVLRIAVLPECQGRGLGKQLLRYIEQHCDADFIGASFSAELQVLRFWQAAHLYAVHLGVHRESATGQHAAVVLKPLKPQALVLYHAIRRDFIDKIPYQLLAQQNTIDPALALALLRDSHCKVVINDIHLLQAYCQQRCSFETAQVDLYRAVLAAAQFLQVDNFAHLLLVQKLLLNQPWHVVAGVNGLTGRAQAEEIIRLALLQVSTLLTEQS